MVVTPMFIVLSLLESLNKEAWKVQLCCRELLRGERSTLDVRATSRAALPVGVVVLQYAEWGQKIAHQTSHRSGCGEHRRRCGCASDRLMQREGVEVVWLRRAMSQRWHGPHIRPRFPPLTPSYQALQR